MQDMIKISSKQHPNVILKAIPGHFVTPISMALSRVAIVTIIWI